MGKPKNAERLGDNENKMVKVNLCGKLQGRKNGSSFMETNRFVLEAGI